YWSTRSKRYTSHRVLAFTTNTLKSSSARCCVESPSLTPVKPTCCQVNLLTALTSLQPTALLLPKANAQPLVVTSSWVLPRPHWQLTRGCQPHPSRRRPAF